MRGLVFLGLCSAALAQQWKPPQPGWIYVLDVGSKSPNGQVLIVNPADGVIEDVIPTGYNPNFGLCPDGSRLYIEYGSQSGGVLTIVETGTGTSIGTYPVENRVLYTVRPSAPGIGCSRDGKWVFVQTMRTLPSGVYQHALTVLAAKSGAAGAEQVPLPMCGVASFMSLQNSDWQVAAECSSTNTVRLVSLTEAGFVDDTRDVALTWSRAVSSSGLSVAKAQRITTSSMSDLSTGAMMFVRGGGGVDRVSPRTLALQPMVTDDEERFSPPGGAALSTKSGVLFVGSMAHSQIATGSGLMDRVSAFRVSDLGRIGTIQTTIPFASLAISADGMWLYTVSPSDKSITVIDTSLMSESKTITGIGQQPVLILTQP